MFEEPDGVFAMITGIGYKLVQYSVLSQLSWLSDSVA